jgi:hypothetical protein
MAKLLGMMLGVHCPRVSANTVPNRETADLRGSAERTRQAFAGRRRQILSAGA